MNDPHQLASMLDHFADNYKDKPTNEEGFLRRMAEDVRSLAQPTEVAAPETQAVWDMLLLDGNCSDHTLTGAAKLRRIIDDLIEARQNPLEGKHGTRAFVCKEHCQKMLNILRPIVQEQMRSDAASSPSKPEGK